MKHIFKNKITNIPDTPLFDNTFLIPYLECDFQPFDGEVYFMGELLKGKENTKLLSQIGDRYAMYANVYSEKDELEIFQSLFDRALETGKKVHIVGITLGAEVEILEKYYKELGFFREDINCFEVDFSKVLVSASVCIENLMWRGSDYKRMRQEIYFLPPIREAGQTKAMFKGITRGVTAGVYLKDGVTQKNKDFLHGCIGNEYILPIHMGKILYYNMQDIGFKGEKRELLYVFE